MDSTGTTRNDRRPTPRPPAPGRSLVRLGCMVVAVAVLAAGLRADATSPVDDVDALRELALPDRTADHVGGIAARLHAGGATPIPGDLFLLLARTGSAAPARLYDRTPYAHDNGVSGDARESNELAVQIVRTLIGTDVALLDLTTAPGGGPSGGVAYALAYLNVVSDGAFTGDLRIAATGVLGEQGHIATIEHIDLKVAAAGFADVDVLFTPTAPSDEVLESYSSRFVGEAARGPGAVPTLHDPGRLDSFHRWGADRPDGMDVVDVRHLVDVAAYLCGAGSSYACHVRELLDEQARQRLDDRRTDERAETERRRAAAR